MSDVSRACSRWWAARDRMVACRPRAGCWRLRMPSGAGRRAARLPATQWPLRETAATSPCACPSPPHSPMTACMLLVRPLLDAWEQPPFLYATARVRKCQMAWCLPCSCHESKQRLLLASFFPILVFAGSGLMNTSCAWTPCPMEKAGMLSME